MSITREEWLQELEQIATACLDPGGVTTKEIAEATGYSRSRVRNMIDRAMAAGLWEMSGRKRTKRIDGYGNLSPCYRPIQRGDPSPGPVEVKPCARSSSSGRKKRPTRS